jgi:hypothetical protein
VRRAQGSTGALWAIDALAVARLTRLVVGDTITEPVRERVLEWVYRRAGDEQAAPVTGWTEYAHTDPEAPKLATLISCPWCVSVYFGMGVSLARRYVPGWDLAAWALAASEVAGLVASREEG